MAFDEDFDKHFGLDLKIFGMNSTSCTAEAPDTLQQHNTLGFFFQTVCIMCLFSYEYP